MQENEFEKQVKEMMEGFRLTPSDTAWQNISRKLKKEQPRRLPFIFLLALSIMVTAGFIFYFTKEKVQERVIAVNNNNNAANTDSVTLQDANNSSLVQKDAAVKTNPALSQSGKTDNSQSASPVNSEKASLKLSVASAKRNKNLSLNRSNMSNEQRNDLPQPVVSPLIKDVIPDADKPVDKELASAEKTGNAADLAKETASADSTLEKNNSVPDSVVNVQNEKAAEVPQQTKKIVASKPVMPKWQWGINASYGKSNAVTNLANTDKSAPQYLSLPVNNGGGVVYHNEYVYKPSTTYSIGVDVQRIVLKNAVLGTGLSFTHISTKSDVSRKVDSTVRSSTNFSGDLISGYFPPGVSSVYTNTYSFIELPLYFQQDFLPRKKFSFSYNAGFSVRQLLSSKSLIYNESNNIYFSKNDMLRKTQFQLLAGLNFKFNTGKTSSIYVGPQFSYSLSNMLKNKDYGNFHFMTYGVKAGLLLHKK